MGDFLLDFRSPNARCRNAEALRFFPDMSVDRIERDQFTLFTTRAGQTDLWAPYEATDGVVVALAGSIAPEKNDWSAAALVGGDGGLVCKAIYAKYREGGIEAVATASGNFAIHIFDSKKGQYFLVNDAAGSLPCYTLTHSNFLYCSHADILSESVDFDNVKDGSPESDWDLTSMAEFLATGVVSHPYSYYKNIVSLDFGCIHAFEWLGPEELTRTAIRHTDWRKADLNYESEHIHAERLAEAISKASLRCTSPSLGKTAIALSGGLDSRTILSAADRHSEVVSFCAFDRQNAEFSFAKRIAEEMNVPLIPFGRSFDHYADHAELGVRISGGMGDIASNHFLGFREKLRELGVDNLVTGCYMDYLFKSLALNSREQGFLRREKFSRFSFRTYLPHFSVSDKFANSVERRLNELFPQPCREESEAGIVSSALRRTFPFYHEGDNAQRLIPLRVMGWNPPAVDPEILALSREMPPAMKLNKRVFRQVVKLICSKGVLAIPDNNTGLPLTASPAFVGLNRYNIAIQNRFERHSKRLATRDSWPNWSYYIRKSKKLRELWLRPNPVARSLLADLCGEPLRQEPGNYAALPTQYFMRLLTLKLWMDMRSVR